MKKVKYFQILFVLSIAALILACEDEKIIFNGPYHVRFTDTAQSFKESFNETIEISVHNAGPQLEEDLLITYVVGGTAREGRDYFFETEKGIVTIPEDESFGYIRIGLINNSNNIIDAQDITLTLISVNNSERTVGLGDLGRRYTLTIVDDCLLGGTYTGTFSDVPGVEGIAITSNDCIEYTVSNWDINLYFGFFDPQVFEFSLPRERSLTFIDNFDNTITIPEQEEPTLEDSIATIRGNGSVDPVTKRITLNVELSDFPGQPVLQLTYLPE